MEGGIEGGLVGSGFNFERKGVSRAGDWWKINGSKSRVEFSI